MDPCKILSFISLTNIFDVFEIWVIPVQKQSQDVCKCVYHENIDSICASLTNKARNEPLEIDYKLIANADSIWKETVCDIYNEDCIWRKCEKCNPRSIEQLFPFTDTSTIIEYFQWETVMVERNGKKDFRMTKKVMKIGTIEEVINHLIELRVDFSVHNHTNINQLHNFKQAKKNLKPNELIISEDFSENYSLKHQNEIMSTHWSQDEITLFCATAHYLKDEESVFIIVHYWSDGPSSQFKNQFNFTNLLFHEKGYGMPADGNVFATSHGKGENDGAGGDVKNSVWGKVLQHKEVVGDLDSFVSVAKKSFQFKSNEIRTATNYLNERYEKLSKALSNTQKLHRITIEGKKVIGHFLTKICPCHNQPDVNQIEDESSIIPTVGQSYKVRYHFLDGKGGEIVKLLPGNVFQK